MHPDAALWLVSQADDYPVGRVVEFGARFVNGSARELVRHVSWHGVDIAPGDGVDTVEDARWYVHSVPVDVVVCCEVAEHCDSWPHLVENAAINLRPGGVLLFTAAGPNRAVHSGVDGNPELHDGEHYANVDPDVLSDELGRWFAASEVETNDDKSDVYAIAWR